MPWRHGYGDLFKIPNNFDPYSNSVSLTPTDVYDLLQTFKEMHIKDTTPSKIISFLNMKTDLLFFETGLNATTDLNTIQ